MLATISEDRARAIVMAVDAVRLPSADQVGSLVQIIQTGPGAGVLLVGANRLLKGIPFLGLAEVAPGHYLLYLTTGTSLADLEVALDDLRESNPHGSGLERAMSAQLRNCLKKVRRTQRVHMA